MKSYLRKCRVCGFLATTQKELEFNASDEIEVIQNAIAYLKEN